MKNRVNFIVTISFIVLILSVVLMGLSISAYADTTQNYYQLSIC